MTAIKDKFRIIEDLIVNFNNNDEDDWAIAYVCNQIYEAQMLRANLIGAGIDCIILTQKDSNYPTIGNLSIVKLLVKKSELKEALNIIKALLSSNMNFDDGKTDKG